MDGRPVHRRLITQVQIRFKGKSCQLKVDIFFTLDCKVVVACAVFVNEILKSNQ